MIFKRRKIVGFRGFAPDPAGGAHSAPPDLLVGSGSPNTGCFATPLAAGEVL